jgi:EmrB/QacA subfamily drug resistance transporter
MRARESVAVTASADPAAGRPRLVLAICCFSLFMAQLDATAVNVALPAIGRDLHAGISGLQWVVDGFVLTLGSLAMSSGAAGDRRGRRLVFRRGLVVFTAASLACSLAPDLRWLIGARMVQGAGASMLMPVTLAIIAATFTEARQRAQAIGLWAAAAGLAAAAGPLLGGVLATTAGWRSIFWINLPIGLVGIALTSRYVPESRSATPRPADLLGQASIIAFVATLTYALIEAPDQGWASAGTLALFSAASCALAAFTAIELRSAAPMIDVRLLVRPALAAAIAAAVLAYLALMGFLFLNALYLQQARDLSPVRAGLAIVPFPAALAVTSPLAGRLLARCEPQLLIGAGGTAIAAGLFALLGAGTATPYLALCGVYLLLGTGWGLLNTPVTNLAVSSMPRQQAGVASALAGSARQVGTVLGVALLGSLASTRLGHVPASGPAASHAAALAAAIHLGYLVGALAAALIIPVAAATFRRG